jgi:hypothetical protein
MAIPLPANRIIAPRSESLKKPEGSHLTPEDRLFMQRHGQFRHHLSETIPDVFRIHFDYNRPPNPKAGLKPSSASNS